MAHEIIASIRIVLPEPMREMTDKLAEVAEAWSGMLKQVEASEGESSFSVNETRAKPATTGAKRGRKARVTQTPALVPPPDLGGEAA